MLSARLTSLSSSTKMNSASLSTKRLISHGQATRSTFTFFLVIHFIVRLLTNYRKLFCHQRQTIRNPPHPSFILPKSNEGRLKPTLIPVQIFRPASLLPRVLGFAKKIQTQGFDAERHGADWSGLK